MIGQTNRQTSEQRLQLYKYEDVLMFIGFKQTEIPNICRERCIYNVYVDLNKKV